MADRRAAHMEASCSNMREEVQQARLETLTERKTASKLRSEVSLAHAWLLRCITHWQLCGDLNNFHALTLCPRSMLLCCIIGEPA